jgi:hypothetical protein
MVIDTSRKPAILPLRVYAFSFLLKHRAPGIALNCVIDESFEESVCDNVYFAARSRRCVNGERRAGAVRHRLLDGVFNEHSRRLQLWLIINVIW